MKLYLEQREDFFNQLSAQIPQEHSNFFSQNKDKIRNAWLKFASKDWIPKILDDNTIQIPMVNKSQSIPIPLFIKHLLWLCDLSNCDGINKLKNGFNNPEQFTSTFFEIRSAYVCFSRKNISNFIFSPEVQTRYGKKYPEFKFNFGQLEVYCECKSLLNVNRANSSEVSEFIRAIDENLKSLSIPNELRLQVHITFLPGNLRINFGDQLVAAVNVLIEKRCNIPIILRLSDAEGEMQCQLVDKASPAPKIGNIIAGFRPRHETKENKDFEIIISCNDKRVGDAIRRNIEEAVSQLPEDAYKIIFIETVSVREGEFIANDIFEKSEYKKLLCLALDDGNGSIKFIINKNYKSDFFDIFA